VASWHQPQFPGPPAFPGGPPVAGGPVLPQGRIESLVIARGAWEVYVHRLRSVPADIPVMVTGWALAAATPHDLDWHVDGVAVALRTDATETRLIGCHGFVAAELQRAPQGTAYGAWALVPTLRGTVVPGELLVSASALTSAPDAPTPEVEVEGAELAVGWPDGGRTTCTWATATPAIATTP
jgi:hypothetical protein